VFSDSKHLLFVPCGTHRQRAELVIQRRLTATHSPAELGHTRKTKTQRQRHKDKDTKTTDLYSIFYILYPDHDRLRYWV